MNRRWLSPLVFLALLLVIPRPAAAQTRLTFKDLPPPRADVSQPWRSLDFGAPQGPFVRVVFETMQGHRLHGGGFVTASPRFGSDTPPIDCAMVRPGDPTLDPKMLVLAPPVRVGHGGVIIPVAPCPRK